MLVLVAPWIDTQLHASYDVNLIGYIYDMSSVSRHTTSFVDCLHEACHLKLFKTFKNDTHSPNSIHRKLIQESINLRNHTKLNRQINQGLELSGITIYTSSLWGEKGTRNAWKEYQWIPNKSILKYAFVVTEFSEISKNQVKIFNENFDALIIPDQWAEEVYKKSGVTIPIFTLPLVLDLKSLYEKPVKKMREKPFIFGFSGQGPHRKNVPLLLNAFSEEFGNDPNIQLILHSRYRDRLNSIKKLIRDSKSTNIKVIHKGFNRAEYENFLSALSCYAILSKAEGFSITPREALAAGIPCVLSNNTAHKVICDTGYVAGVRSDILEPIYSDTSRKPKGFMFNCTLQETRKALRDIYERYDHYLKCAEQGREWTKQYLAENLKSKYMNLVQPLRVVLGKENKVTDEYIMVNSRILFDKYRLLCARCNTIFVE